MRLVRIIIFSPMAFIHIIIALFVAFFPVWVFFGMKKATDLMDSLAITWINLFESK